VEVPKPDGATQKQVASPLKFSGSAATYRHIGVEVGQHTREVLAETGYSTSQIDQMQEQGLFG
jgi:crotonobetainyl-CoA:carnitine CoA-transferase CaiB-like acyl-CoA transferase